MLPNLRIMGGGPSLDQSDQLNAFFTIARKTCFTQNRCTTVGSLLNMKQYLHAVLPQAYFMLTIWLKSTLCQ